MFLSNNSRACDRFSLALIFDQLHQNSAITNSLFWHWISSSAMKHISAPVMLPIPKRIMLVRLATHIYRFAIADFVFPALEIFMRSKLFTIKKEIFPQSSSLVAIAHRYPPHPEVLLSLLDQTDTHLNWKSIILRTPSDRLCIFYSLRHSVASLQMESTNEKNAQKTKS